MAMSQENGVVFREVQKFGKSFRWLLVLLMLAIAGGAFAATVSILRGSADIPSTLLGIVCGIILPVGISVLFLVLRLETEVRADGLYVRYFPVHINYRKFGAENLSEYYACQYRPILEYGGWGIRCSRKGRAYNVSGNKGVQLVFQDGKRLLIGSQRPNELEKAIRSTVAET
jgi:hypothetical protein